MDTERPLLLVGSASLVGTWSLLSFTLQDHSGRVVENLLGRRSQGLLTYTEDGVVSFQLIDPERIATPPASPESAEVADVARAFTYFGYVGTYTRNGDRVTHHVLYSNVPAWSGSSQIRRVHLTGDQLTLSAPTRPSDGQDGREARTPVITWQRLSPPPGQQMPNPGEPAHVDLTVGRFHYIAWNANRTELPCAVLLHGNGGSACSWSRVAPALANRYRVYAPDLRGHGGNVRLPAGSYGLRDAADDIGEFLTALDLRHPLLAGHSWGAAVALVLAAGHGSNAPPPRLSALALEDLPATMAFPERVILSLQQLASTPPAELRRRLLLKNPTWHPVDIESMVYGFERADPRVVRSIIDDGSRTGPLLPLLARVTAPLLLLRADPRRGGLLNDADWQAARRHLPANATAQEVPGSAHNIHYDRFKEFMTIIGHLQPESGSPRP
ncbi:alpha/beta fold hydrolase [Streptomyces wedmorensis]|uniref:alpha/beta fold hydrolase n=1 Tax=Streptomyces wedmorensis TaxID=43759 RepID=UPI003799CC6F